MMTKEKAPASLAPAQHEEFPPLEAMNEKLLPLEGGCLIWIGSFHPKTGPFMKWHGRQIQVHRALYWYEYGVLPKFQLRRQCEPSACVAPAHRALSACA
jgi:hypothetical protein